VSALLKLLVTSYLRLVRARACGGACVGCYFWGIFPGLRGRDPIPPGSSNFYDEWCPARGVVVVVNVRGTRGDHLVLMSSSDMPCSAVRVRVPTWYMYELVLLPVVSDRCSQMSRAASASAEK